MKWFIYHSAVVALNTAAAFIFKEHLNINIGALAPVIVMAMMAFQAYYFYTNRTKKDFNTNNDSYLTEAEWNVMSLYISRSFNILIPFCIPFILFFPAALKTLSLLIYIFAFIIGPIIYRARNGKAIKARVENEAAELAQQNKNEELGNF